MSSKEAGRQSPPPSDQSKEQIGQNSNAHTQKSQGPEASKNKDQSKDQLKNLESNPKGPLEDVAKTKVGQ